MKRTLGLIGLLLFVFVRTEAALSGGLIVGYDEDSKLFEARFGSGRETIRFTDQSDTNKVQALKRVMRLWYMQGSSNIEDVVLLDIPEIKIVVEDMRPKIEREIGAPLLVTLKEWNIRLPIVLSSVTEKEGAVFYVLDDPNVAFTGALNAAELKRFVLIDKAEIEKCRQKKAKWLARGQDIYHFVTTGLFDKLAKTREPNKIITARRASRVAD